MNVAAHARVNLERELRQAVERDELELWYRPMLDTRSGRIAGAEAVLRWERPGREQRLPVDFFQIAEETGLVEPIGEWMLEQACRQFRAWHAAGVDVPRVALDVSARQFEQRGFVERVRRIVGAAATAPYCLDLEINERLLIDAGNGIAPMLDEFRALGLTFASTTSARAGAPGASIDSRSKTSNIDRSLTRGRNRNRRGRDDRNRRDGACAAQACRRRRGRNREAGGAPEPSRLPSDPGVVREPGARCDAVRGVLQGNRGERSDTPGVPHQERSARLGAATGQRGRQARASLCASAS
jgi:hypothetical protein